MPSVDIPNIGVVDFPDNMSRDDIVKAIREVIIPRYGTPQVAQQEAGPSSFSPGSAVSRGVNTFQSQLYSALEGAGRITGSETLARTGGEGRVRNIQEAEAAQPGQRPSFETAESLGDYGRATGQVVAESLPFTGVGLAGAKAGEVAAKRIAGAGLGLRGRLVGAALGAAATSLPTFYGSNRQRQIEEGGQVSSEGAALAAAVPQALSESITDVFLARLGKFFRGGIEEAGKTLLPRIAAGIGIGAASEVPTEVLQQALERGQAGLDLLSPDAMKEYRQAAIAAAAAGGTIGGTVSGVFGQRPQAQTEPREAEDAQLYQSLADIQADRDAGQVDIMPAVEQPQDIFPVEEDLTQARFVSPGGVTPQATAQTPQQVSPPAEEPSFTANRHIGNVITEITPEGFTTAKGSTYQVNEQGQTIRTKLSPGRGQGTTYEPHNVLYVSPEESVNLLEDMRDGGKYRFAVNTPEGPRFLGPNEAFNGRPSALAVLNRDGSFNRYIEAQTDPAVGLAPVELRYDPAPEAASKTQAPVAPSQEAFVESPELSNLLREAPDLVSFATNQAIGRTDSWQNLSSEEKQRVAALIDRVTSRPRPSAIKPIPKEGLSDQQYEYLQAVQQQNIIRKRIDSAIASAEQKANLINNRIDQLKEKKQSTAKLEAQLLDLQKNTYKQISGLSQRLSDTQQKIDTASGELLSTREGQIQAKVQAKTKSDAASGYIADQIESLRKQSVQGQRIAEALEEAIADPQFNAEQLYGAFVAAKSLSDVLPKNANHKVKFLGSILINDNQQKQAEASGGKVGQEAGGYRVAPPDTSVSGIIAISLSPNAYPLARQIASHEAFHVLQDYYGQYDPNFMRVADAAFKDNAPISTIDKSIQRKLQNIKAPNGLNYWQDLTQKVGDAPVSRREAQAYVYAALYDASRRGVPMSGLKPSIARFISFLRDFFSNTKNFLNGQGFNNANDLFSQAVEKGGTQFEQAAPIAAKPTSGVEFAARSVGMTTPEFKSWFGDSKVVDDNGNPLVVYHGTSKDKDFNSFKLGKRGAWFTTRPEEASSYAAQNDSMNFKYNQQTGKYEEVNIASRVIPAYLSIQNPAVPTEQELARLSGNTGESNYAKVQAEVFADMLARGHDGVKLPDGVWVVLSNPSQIKSAIGNRGTFSQTDKRMEFAALRTNTTVPEFTGWFADSQIVNPDGSPKVMYHGTGKSFKRFTNAKSGAIKGAQGPFFFSDDPNFASDYAESDLSVGGRGLPRKKGAVVYPVYISAKNPFDFQNPEHVANINSKVDWAAVGRAAFGRDVSPGTIQAYKNILSNGDWKLLERPELQRAIREAGYDGFYMNENGYKNLAVYEPSQIKSIFNDFKPGTASEAEFMILNGTTGGTPPFGSRTPPVTPRAAGATELQMQYNVAAKYLGKKFGNYVEPAKIERFFTAFQDKMLPVGRMVDEINANGGNISIAMNAYVQEDLMQGKVADMLEKRGNTLYRPLVDAVSKSGMTIQDFENFLYARHAGERNRYIASINPRMPDAGSGLSTAEANNMLAEFQRRGNMPKLLELAEQFDAIVADTNRLRVSSGLTPDFSTMNTTADGNLLPNYRYYAPLRGFADESVNADETVQEFRPRTKRMLGAKGREDMRATGRERMAGDIIAHAIMQNTQAVIRAEQNAVGQSFLAMVRANPTQAANFAEVISSAPLRTAIVNGVVKSIPDMFYKNNPDILVVKEGGKEVAIRIKDPAIARAMNGTDTTSPTTSNTIVKGLASVNRFLAKINTAYNPEFILTNLARDLQTFAVNVQQFDVDGITKKSIADLPGALSGVRDAIRGSNNNPQMMAYYNRFKELGGTTEAYGFSDLETRIKEINDIMATTGTTAKSWKEMAEVIKPVGKFIEDYNTVVENGIRTSLFKNLVESGINEQQAAQIAKNATVNFTKGGEHRVLMNSLYLFYNASLQGTMAMVNAIGRSPKVRKIVGGIVVAGLLQDVLNSVLSGEDDDGGKIYDKIPDHILKRSFVLMDPFKISERGYFSFPMPYGFNAFHNMGREMSKVARGKSSPMNGAGNIIGAFTDAFNPIGGSNSWLNFVAPTILDPVVDLSTNKDFTGRPIVPERGSYGVQQPDSQKYWNNTFAPYVGIAQFLNEITGGTPVIPGAVDISPNTIKYVMNYITGGVGRFAERTFNTVFSTIPSALSGDLNEIDVREVPVFRSLYGNVTSRNDMEQFMKRSEEVLRIRQEIKQASETGQSERINSMLTNYPGQVELMETFSRISRDRSKISQEINKISRNPNIPDSVKKEVIKSLREQQNMLVNTANRLYNERVTNRQ